MTQLRQVSEAKFKFSSHIPDKHIKSLNGKLWDYVKNSREGNKSKKDVWFDLQNLLLTDQPNLDLAVGEVDVSRIKDRKEKERAKLRNAECLQMREAMYAMMPTFVSEALSMLNPVVTDMRAFDFPEKLHETHQVSKSRFFVDGLYETVSSYLTEELNRDTDILTIDAQKIFQSHAKQMEEGIVYIASLEPEEQEELLLSYLASGKNEGYPNFDHQNKKTFRDRFLEFAKGFNLYKEKKDKDGKVKIAYITVELIVEVVQAAIKHPNETQWPQDLLKEKPQGLVLPFVLFRRTQGGKTTKIRAVFGGSILLKAMGLILSAARKVETFKYVKIGDLTWIAGLDWDSMFEGIKDTMTKTCTVGGTLLQGNELKRHGVEWVGEDFSGFDMTIRKNDLDWVLHDKEIPKIYKLFWEYVLLCLSYSEVWTGEKAVLGVFFKSGHPLTSEMGSLVHLMITYYVASITGWKVKHSTYLSDDNLTCWGKSDTNEGYGRRFNVKSYVKICKKLGFEVSESKTFVYSRDLYVKFLMVWIGCLVQDGKLDYLGDLNSRYYGYLHAERPSSDVEVGLWKVTGDLPVDQFLSKFASLGYLGVRLVQVLVNHEEFRLTKLGRKIIAAIEGIKRKEYVPSPTIDEILVGFNPSLLAGVTIDTDRNVRNLV